VEDGLAEDEAADEEATVLTAAVVMAAAEVVVPAALLLVEVAAVGGVTVIVTPASAQNASRSAGRAAKSAALQAFSAHGVTMGVRMAEALHTQAKSTAEHPVGGTALTKQLNYDALVTGSDLRRRCQHTAQLGSWDKLWA
jgi:hypothetical protein